MADLLPQKWPHGEVLPNWTNDTCVAALETVGLFVPNPDPDSTVLTLDRAEEYLLATGCGESHFSAEEFFVGQAPLVAHLPRIALLRWLLDQCRKDLPIRIAHYYRDPERNAAVGGAPRSAHIYGCAVDIDLHNDFELRRVGFMLTTMWNSPVHWDMGLGIGDKRIHIDLFSPAGHRRWLYPTAKIGWADLE